MAQVDTVLKDFILNVLSDEEFQKLTTKDGNQLYFTDLIEYYTKEEARALMTLFRGQFANWESVPTSIADYASDFSGSKTPTQNNIMVVKDASGYATDACDILSHVQSTGTQYINLGIIPTVGMKYVASFQASNSTTGTIFGTDRCDMHVYQGEKNPVTEINIGTSTLNTIGVSSGFDINYELTVKEKGVVSKASNITLSNPYSGDLPTTEMYLLAKNTADNATNFSACIVKGFKVYEGETLLMDLVPARRVLDGAIGFMDVTTNIFYENLGADPLIAGDVVSGGETPTDINGSWLFIYNGKWNENGKSGWTPAFALGGSGGGSMPDRYVESINGWTGNVFLGAHEIGTYTSDEIDEKIAEAPEILPILFHTWSDCIMNNQSWLRADTFSWHSGDVYVAAYNRLVDGIMRPTMYAWSSSTYTFYTLTDVPAIGDDVYFVNKNYGTTKVLSVSNDTITFEHHRTGETTTATRNPSSDTNALAYGLNKSTETIGGVTITYYRSEDGRKICLPDQESNLLTLYNSTGVAWYYILDTENKQFKLPRTKFGFTGLRDSVGGYVEAGLPNITGQMKGGLRCYETNGAFKTLSNYNKAPNDYDYGSVESVEFDASRSSSVYGNSNTVQPPATQMYLYFYVGNFEQSAVEQTAGLNTELFNGKADVNLNNTPFASLDNDGGTLKWNGASIIAPAGIVSAFAGKTAPSGWLKCDGSAVSRTTYATLFAAIGTLYGAGDGSTTFNLPNLIGRVPFGMDGNYVGQTTNGVLPNITGNLNGISEEFAQMGTASGAFRKENNITQNSPTFSGNGNSGVVSFNASRSNSMYGNGWFSGERVVPSSVGMTYCIKY